MAPEVLLPSEALPTRLTGVRPLTRVGADVAFQDPLLLGRVGAERTFVKLDWHNQHVTWNLCVVQLQKPLTMVRSLESQFAPSRSEPAHHSTVTLF